MIISDLLNAIEDMGRQEVNEKYRPHLVEIAKIVKMYITLISAMKSPGEGAKELVKYLNDA